MPICLFICGCAGSALLHRFFSCCVKWSLFSNCGKKLLMPVASLVAEHRLQDARASVAAAPGLLNTGSVLGVRGLSCPTTCGIFPDWGSDAGLLHWQANSLPLSQEGIPTFIYFAGEGIVGVGVVASFPHFKLAESTNVLIHESQKSFVK